MNDDARTVLSGTPPPADQRPFTPMAAGLGIMSPAQLTGMEPPALILGGIALVLLILNLWVLVRLGLDRSERRRNDQLLMARLLLLEARVAHPENGPAREFQARVPASRNGPSRRMFGGAGPDGAPAVGRHPVPSAAPSSSPPLLVTPPGDSRRNRQRR